MKRNFKDSSPWHEQIILARLPLAHVCSNSPRWFSRNDLKETLYCWDCSPHSCVCSFLFSELSIYCSHISLVLSSPPHHRGTFWSWYQLNVLFFLNCVATLLGNNVFCVSGFVSCRRSQGANLRSVPMFSVELGVSVQWQRRESQPASALRYGSSTGSVSGTSVTICTPQMGFFHWKDPMVE